jgi:hypothetical protein
MSTNQTDRPLVYFNGIDGATGRYHLEPHHPFDFAQRVVGPSFSSAPGRPIVPLAPPPPPPSKYGRLSLIGADDSAVDPRTGWALVFAEGESDEVKRALEPLIAHRKQQVGPGYRELVPYIQGCSWLDWLGAHDVSPGGFEPAKIPWYLVLVGGPDRIPFGFQYLLSVEYAVGRIAFETPDEYAAYAESVVRYETSNKVEQGNWGAFFGTRHPDDGATQASADRLAGPLAAVPWQFRSRSYFAEQATKTALHGLLHGADEQTSPALLFTATHGIAFPRGHALTRERNGALLCQEWPGVAAGTSADAAVEALAESQYFSAADVGDEARLHGTIAFHFACFGAGTPLYDQFANLPGAPPRQLADAPFVARLPQRLLSHKAGGALAVIGHVDRAWSYSFQTSSAGNQIGPFRETIQRLFRGQSVGRAIREFRDRYATLCVYAMCVQQKMEAGEHIDAEAYAEILTECEDAQNYIILGDPAVSLRVAELA